MFKQKLASYERFDPRKEFFKRGAPHMPLMIYIGSSKDTRRTPKALAKRAAHTARRGWTYDRIQNSKAGNETSGGGEHSKGKGKHKGKGAHAHGHGEPSDGQIKGGKGDRSDGWEPHSRYWWHHSWAEW